MWVWVGDAYVGLTRHPNEWWTVFWLSAAAGKMNRAAPGSVRVAEVTMFTTERGNRDHWNDVVKRTKKCPFCPPHDRENRGRRCRPDRKNPRRK